LDTALVYFTTTAIAAERTAVQTTRPNPASPMFLFHLYHPTLDGFLHLSQSRFFSQQKDCFFSSLFVGLLGLNPTNVRAAPA
jgi:hypothetical protein